MGRLTFDLVWQKIAEMEGRSFRTSNGGEFRYRFHKTYVVVSPGEHSIPRTYFDKIFRRLEQGSLEGAPSLQGQSFIVVILEQAGALG